MALCLPWFVILCYALLKDTILSKMRICIGREQFIVYVTLSSKENYNYLYVHMGMVVPFLQLLREEGVDVLAE